MNASRAQREPPRQPVIAEDRGDRLGDRRQGNARSVLSSMCGTIRQALFSAGVAATLCAATARADAQSASTYEASCRHIGVAGKTLYADCRRNAGVFKQTALPIAGIDNDNGALRFTTMYRASTFQDSCTDIVVSGTMLSARCRRADGGFVRTSIAIPGIENVDGDLRYSPSRPPAK